MYCPLLNLGAKLFSAKLSGTKLSYNPFLTHLVHLLCQISGFVAQFVKICTCHNGHNPYKMQWEKYALFRNKMYRFYALFWTQTFTQIFLLRSLKS